MSNGESIIVIVISIWGLVLTAHFSDVRTRLDRIERQNDRIKIEYAPVIEHHNAKTAFLKELK